MRLFGSAILWISGLIVLSGASLKAEVGGDLGLGLPKSVPEADPVRAELRVLLGERLFFDTRLSASGKVSCGSCHQPARAFSDELVTARGIASRIGSRNTPSLLNVGYLRTIFADGRRDSLEEQGLDPFVSPVELGLSSHEQVLSKIRGDREYRRAFEEAFRVSAVTLSMNHVTQAIATFERTLVSGNSPFDRFYFGKDANALSDAAKRGLDLFRSRAKCATCHVIQKDFALFTDQQFHASGIGYREVNDRLGRLVRIVKKLGKPAAAKAILTIPDIAALGRYVVTLDPADIGRFKTPSLRNVALTAPYMHDGSFKTLKSAIEWEIYFHNKDSSHPTTLTENEKADLQDFLISLSSGNISSVEMSPTIRRALSKGSLDARRVQN